MHLPKTYKRKHEQKERDLGRDLDPWQEEVVGNDPTGWNLRRAAGDGDPVRLSGAVLEQEREREAVGRETDEWV